MSCTQNRMRSSGISQKMCSERCNTSSDLNIQVLAVPLLGLIVVVYAQLCCMLQLLLLNIADGTQRWSTCKIISNRQSTTEQ
jgi:hypothetical protein